MLSLINKFQVDCIGAPSGYGLPLKLLQQLTDEDYFLLALKRGEEPYMLRTFLKKLSSYVNCPCYILPSVKHLSTVPVWKKINRIDLGTADKLCAAAWSMYNFALEREIELVDINLVHVELGYGFNAFISVEQGKITGGIGGSCSSSGFSSGGFLDAEIAYLLRKTMSKSTVFSGGGGAGKVKTPAELITIDKNLWEAYLNGILVDIARVDPDNQLDVVYLSGRFSNDSILVKTLEDKLKRRGKNVVQSKSDDFSSFAAKGSAMIVNGIMGGDFESLVDTLEISAASGSVLDYINYSLET